MDASGIYSEKKLAFYETTYKENILSKPQEINLTVTPVHIYGIAYICEQIGTRENDPEYGRFTCNVSEISKVSINTNNKNSPIYIQCETEDKYVINRRRIILPSFGARNDEIVSMILSAKEKLNEKTDIEPEPKPDYIPEKTVSEKPDNIVKEEPVYNTADNDFESFTAEIPVKDKTVETEEIGGTGKPDSKPLLEAVFTEEKSIPKPEYSASEILNDMLGIDDILSVLEEPGTSAGDAFFETIDITAADELVKTMPEEIIQKNPADIEEIVIPQIVEEDIPADTTAAAPYTDEIEVIDTAGIIKQKLAEKERKNTGEAQENENMTKASSAVAENKEEKKPDIQEEINKPFSSVSEIKVISQTEDKPAVSLSLEEFETAVKKLKIMLDTGTITESEFAYEKKKLLFTLY